MDTSHSIAIRYAEEHPLRDGLHFVRSHWMRIVLVSAVLLVPCVWHHHIQAGDLPSHVYNAWLADLVKHGQAPGLSLVQRWNNILFDSSLSWLGPVIGWVSAERIVTGASVLIFFWGAFALACAVSRQIPWFILPAVGIVTYGYTFQLGFLNCYLSIGLAFWGLVILLRASGWKKAWVVLMIPLIALAHATGVGVLVVIGAYIVLRQSLSARYRVYMLLSAVLMLVVVHVFLRVHYSPQSFIWRYEPEYIHDGLNQVLLYGSHYLLPARLLRTFGCLLLLFDIACRIRTRQRVKNYLLPAELYLLGLLAMVLIPTQLDIGLLRRLGLVSVSFVTERLTTVLAVLFLCLIGTARPHKWQAVGLGIISVIFFAFLYIDTGTIDKVEDDVHRLVLTTPPGQRVVGTIMAFRNTSAVTTTHIIDRACLGHAFSFGNYEPGTNQFRVHADAENRFVLTNWDDSNAVLHGGYVVQPRDLPLYEIVQPDLAGSPLQIHQLVSGSKTASPIQLGPCLVLEGYSASAWILDLAFALLGVAVALAFQRLASVQRSAAN